jgi:hypothetical protein
MEVPVNTPKLRLVSLYLSAKRNYTSVDRFFVARSVSICRERLSIDSHDDFRGFSLGGVTAVRQNDMGIGDALVVAL